MTTTTTEPTTTQRELHGLFSAERLIAALPADCRELPRRRRRITLFRVYHYLRSGEAIPGPIPEEHFQEAAEVGQEELVSLGEIIVEVPEVFPHPNPEHALGPALSDRRDRVEAWLQRGCSPGIKAMISTPQTRNWPC